MNRATTSTSGYTLVEMLMSVALFSTAGLLVAGFLRRPADIQRYISSVDQERLVNNAMSVIVNDLVEADQASIDFAHLYPNSQTGYSAFQVTKTLYSSFNSNVLSVNTIQYVFQATGNGSSGSLIRRMTVGVNPTTSTTVLQNVVTPTASHPFVQIDPITNNILILTVQYQPMGASPVNLVRRVGINAQGSYAPS